MGYLHKNQYVTRFPLQPLLCFDSLEIICNFLGFAVSWIGETLTRAGYVETAKDEIVQQCCTILDKISHIFVLIAPIIWYKGKQNKSVMVPDTKLEPELCSHCCYQKSVSTFCYFHFHHRL